MDCVSRMAELACAYIISENEGMADYNRFESLRTLSPVNAVKAWLDGDFGFGEETALIEAIRKDSRITRTDDEIIDFMADALMGETGDARQCLDRLAGGK